MAAVAGGPNRPCKTRRLWRYSAWWDVVGQNVRHVDLDQSQISPSADHLLLRTTEAQSVRKKNTTVQ